MAPETKRALGISTATLAAIIPVLLGLGAGWGGSEVTNRNKLDAPRFVTDSIRRDAHEQTFEARRARADSVTAEVRRDVKTILCRQNPHDSQCPVVR